MKHEPLPEPDEHAVSPTARQKILAAAAELFTARGYAATSVREIVEHAGLTKPALYYHFGSKEGIYLEILRDIHLRMDEALSRLTEPAGSSRERLDRFAVGLFALFEENLGMVRFMNAVFWGPPHGAPPFDFRTLHDSMHQAIGKIVGEGIARGELRPVDPADAAHAFISVLSFSMDFHLVYPELSQGKAGLRRVLDLLYQGFGNPTRQETAS